MGKLKYLVIHCTATTGGREVTACDIARWHLSPPPEGRGWKQVGYTDMILLNGAVSRLVNNNEDSEVDPWEITNGVAGINSVSRHIVYVGGLDAKGKPVDNRTPAQRNALRTYVLDFVKKYPDVKVAGHNQFASKDCPCFDVPKWCAEIGVPPQNIYQP